MQTFDYDNKSLKINKSKPYSEIIRYSTKMNKFVQLTTANLSEQEVYAWLIYAS